MTRQGEETLRRLAEEWTQCIELVEETCVESACSVCSASVGTCCRHCLHVLAAQT